jgi:hypothetical protein
MIKKFIEFLRSIFYVKAPEELPVPEEHKAYYDPSQRTEKESVVALDFLKEKEKVENPTKRKPGRPKKKKV